MSTTTAPDIVLVPLSYLEYYHSESKQNPFYSSPEKIQKQEEILHKLKEKGGVGEDSEIAIKRSELEVFQLIS